MNWNKLYEQIIPYVVLIETPDSYGTGFLFAYNQTGNFAAIATAAHVVEHVDKWELPLKLKFFGSKKEQHLTSDKRIIFLDRNRDSASIVVENDDIGCPKDVLKMMDSTKFARIGTDVGWVGFPHIAKPQLCFFTGTVSAFVSQYDSYLIDGVAINGVSGGPVFIGAGDDTPKIIGSVSTYLPNRIQGDALPGLLSAQDVTSFQDTIAKIRSLDEAARKKQEMEKWELQTKEKVGEEKLPRESSPATDGE